jgi:hypothetical protein
MIEEDANSEYRKHLRDLIADFYIRLPKELIPPNREISITDLLREIDKFIGDQIRSHFLTNE